MLRPLPRRHRLLLAAILALALTVAGLLSFRPWEQRVVYVDNPLLELGE